MKGPHLAPYKGNKAQPLWAAAGISLPQRRKFCFGLLVIEDDYRTGVTLLTVVGVKDSLAPIFP